MRPESWVWWTTEPRLRRLHVLLGLIGLALIFKLILVLAAPDGDGPAPVVFDRAEHCVEPAITAILRREGLARVLSSPFAAKAVCWREVSLPVHQEAVVTPTEPAAPSELALGRAWFRVSYAVPPNWPAGEHLLIYVPRVMGSAWQLSVDGVALADDLDDWRMTWNRPVTVTVLPAQVQPGQVLNIEIKVAYIPKLGHSMSRITVGPASLVGRSAAWREFLQLTMPQACSAVLLLLGAFFFAFWLVRRDETAHLLLALASVAWWVCNLQYALPRHDDPALEAWYGGIVNMSVAWFMWLLYQFALRFDERRIRWVEWALPLYVVVMSVLALPVQGPMLDDLGIWFQGVNAAAAAGVTLLVGVLAWRGGSAELRMIALALLAALAAGTHDVALLAQAVHPESIYLLPYGGVLVFGSFLFALQRRYVHAIDEYERLSRSLAQRLAEREAELTQNHLKLRELERANTLATERRRLMRDMHDGLGSALTSSLTVVERGEARPAAVASMLRECIDDLRVVIDSLEPMDNDLVALLATLRFRVGQRLSAAGVTLAWSVQDLPSLEWMGPPEALQVMRIVQEALSNVVKHAKASSAQLTTTWVGGEVMVSISDNGVGFDVSVPSPGRGLRFLKQRAAVLGGEVEIESTPNGGTTVRLRLPVNPAKSV